MEKIYKTPLIVLIASTFCCCSGVFLDLATHQREGLIGPIGLFAGLIIGMVILWKSSGSNPLEFLGQYFNPFYNKRQEYLASMIVNTSERQAFNFCASAFHASNLRYELHPDLGSVLALQPSRTFIFDNLVISLGVDIEVRVDKIDAEQTAVIIGTKSRRGFWSLWMATMGERWLYESKTVADTLAAILITILDRQEIEHTDLQLIPK